MDIAKMHVWFRQYAQQMGMQNVRAILPEQIDICINTAITDTVNRIVQENVLQTNDRVVTDNSKLGSINSLNTLYKVEIIDMSPALGSKETRLFDFVKSDRLTGRMTTNFNKIDSDYSFPDYLFLVDFSLNYKKVKNNLGYKGDVRVGEYYKLLTPISAVDGTNQYTAINPIKDTITLNVLDADEEEYKDITFKYSSKNGGCLVPTSSSYSDKMLGVDYYKDNDGGYNNPHYQLTTSFSAIHYNDGERAEEGMLNPVIYEKGGYEQPLFDEDGVETNYFPVRIIDDVFLADTLNDFVLKNRLRSPIIVSYNNHNDSKNFDLYIDKFNKVIGTDGSERYLLANDLLPYKLRMSYIAKPAKVKYDEDLTGANVDCDLPEYLHVDILKHAVDLYRIAVTGSLHAQQQQQQAAQQENVRNNYRDEGTQQQ